MSDVKKFDLKEAISDRIKDEFIKLIPEEQWNELVSTVVNDFTRDKRASIHHREEPSEMSRIVRAALKTECNARIQEEVKLLVEEFNVGKMLRDYLLSEVGRKSLLENAIHQLCKGVVTNLSFRFGQEMLSTLEQIGLTSVRCQTCGTEYDKTEEPHPYCCGSSL